MGKQVLVLHPHQNGNGCATGRQHSIEGLFFSLHFSVPRDFRAPGGTYVPTIHGARVQAQRRMLVNGRHLTILVARGKSMTLC